MDDGGSPMFIGFIVCLVFIVLDAVLFGYGAAVQAVSDSEIEQREKSGAAWKAELIKKYRMDPEYLVSTIQAVTSLLCMIIGVSVIYTVSGRWGTFFTGLEAMSRIPAGLLHGLAKILAILLFLFLLYTFGIHIPKIMGKHNPAKWAFGLAGIVSFIVAVLSPFTKLMTKLAHLIVRVFGVEPGAYQDDVTEEEIISMINEGHEQGMLEANEAEMMNNIIEFGDKDAGDIMTHRKNIVGVENLVKLREALDFMLNAANSRFPVYEGDIDNVTGILYLKDAMKFHTAGTYDDWLIKDIPGLIREAVFIPETRKINLLFKSMQSKKMQMAMVADEYGQTAGLVALEDILEEIVGNIQDEYDVEENMIERLSDSVYLMDGMADLEEVEDALDIKFELEEDIETLNGFLVSKLEKIPAEDERSVIEAFGCRFEILSVAKKIIQKIRVTKIIHEIPLETKEKME